MDAVRFHIVTNIFLARESDRSSPAAGTVRSDVLYAICREHSHAVVSVHESIPISRSCFACRSTRKRSVRRRSSTGIEDPMK